MARAKSYNGPSSGAATGSAGTAAVHEEDIGLLAAGQDTDGEEEEEEEEEEDLVVLPDGRNGRLNIAPPAASATIPSALGLDTRTPRTPRTPNRVRFDLTPVVVGQEDEEEEDEEEDGRRHRGENGWPANGAVADPRDSFDIDAEPENAAMRRQQQRLPLLTDIEAPAVALANSPWGAGEADDEALRAAARTRVPEDVHAWAERERARPKSGLRSAFMNMANSIIGAGIIGQPYALRQAGLLAGVALLLVLTVAVDWTIRLIVINSKLSGASSFQGTVERCFGRPGLIAISLAQWVFAFGGMVAFGVIVGDSIPHVLLAVWPGLREMPVLGLLADRRTVIVVFTLGVSYPLTLYRDIAKLARASTFALLSMMVIIVTVIVQGVLTPAAERGSFSAPLLTVNTGIFQAIGVISFAFVCHHNSLLIYGSLKTPTIDRFSRVTHYSTAVSMVACLVLALAGFLTFGDRTLGNVLNNFPADNTMVNVARLCFGLNMLTTLPLEAFVCREVMLNYYFPGEPFNMNLHLILSSSLVVSAMTLSLVTCDLGVIFELVGATSACAMAYILPPLCYIKLTTRSWKTYVAGGVVAFGCTVMAISMLQAVAKIIRGEGGMTQCM